MGLMIWVFLWGFAEATLFFIIPDVLLSAIALNSGKKAVIACLYALIGALIGGTIMYNWGATDKATALSIMEKVPAINHEMVMEVNRSIREEGLVAMLVGPTRGIPYKIYAVSSHGLGISYFSFLATSIPARFIRFIIVTLLSWFIAKYLIKKLSIKVKYGVWAATWLVVYIFYFMKHPF